MSAACQRCLFQRCLCSEVPTIVTRTRVVIVRHHLERHRSSNTGRLAHLALPNSEIVDYGGRRLEAHEAGRRLEAHDGALGGVVVLPPLDGAWLLFPEGDRGAPAEPPRQLVVLDATWSQARRMFRKISALRGLPILRLPPGPMAASRLREAPGPGMVSTIEAIARALAQLEGTGDELETLFQVAVQRAAATGRRL